MTIQKAARIIGFDVSVNTNPQCPGSHFAYVHGEDGLPRMGKCGDSQSEALEELIRENYKEQSEIALKRANYRCERCGGTGGLQIHHRKYRSHGRDDRAENLQVVDQACHEKIHRKGRT